MTVLRRRLARGAPLYVLLPSMVAIAVFVYGFIAWTFRVSLTSWEGLVPVWDFVGLDNYVDLFNDRRFQIDLVNTVLFTVPFVGGSMALGLFMAILIDQRIRFESFFRTIYL